MKFYYTQEKENKQSNEKIEYRTISDSIIYYLCDVVAQATTYILRKKAFS